jgi:rhodanese-related sulfurtransferase
MRVLPLSLVILTALLAGCGGEPPADMRGTAAALAKVVADERDHVTAAELADWLIQDRGDFTLVDIRDAQEFAAGHIEQARHVPLAALLSDAALADLPAGRRVVLYSNGTAHAAQGALLLRMVERDAYALLGGFNYWQAYLNDPASAGAAEMDPVERAQYQAVACHFAGDYVAEAGLLPKGGSAVARAVPAPAAAPAADPDPLGLGLGLGLGSETVREALPAAAAPPAPRDDPLGLGLDLGLGGEAAESLKQEQSAPPAGNTGRLLIKAEC